MFNKHLSCTFKLRDEVEVGRLVWLEVRDQKIKSNKVSMLPGQL